MGAFFSPLWVHRQRFGTHAKSRCSSMSISKSRKILSNSRIDLGRKKAKQFNCLAFSSIHHNLFLFIKFDKVPSLISEDTRHAFFNSSVFNLIGIDFQSLLILGLECYYKRITHYRAARSVSASSYFFRNNRCYYSLLWFQRCKRHQSS